MNFLLLFPIAVTFLGGVLLALAPGLSEKATSRVATGAAIAHSISTLVLGIVFLLERLSGAELLFLRDRLFEVAEHQFELDFFLDGYGLTYLMVTTVLGGLVVRFSHRYMHREAGRTRFFATLLFFLSGMSVLSLAEDLGTFFLGWEVVGISSYLLIAFYRSQEEPVRNALRAFSIYRLCDVGLLFSALLGHQLLHAGFREFSSPEMKTVILSISPAELFALSVLPLLAACGKSAQLPFTFWLPRAMVGPTPSSAIFYGALSVHAGVLLLIRTFPIWSLSSVVPWLVGGIGLATALLASLASRVQSNIKSQIAYASATQVGLMFVELALGFPGLALFHFVSNASLRCYQLLVSPSVVVYLLKMQSTSTGELGTQMDDSPVSRRLPERLATSLYALGMAEGYFERWVRTCLWNLPLRVSRWLQWRSLFIHGAIVAALLLGVNSSILLSLAAFLLSPQAFGVREPRGVLILVWFASLTLAAAIMPELHHVPEELGTFLAGVTGGLVLSLVGVRALARASKNSTLRGYRGMAAGHPISARLSFIGILAMIGFPISPAFLGEDLLLSAALRMHPLVPLAFALSFVLSGIALIRMFTRLYLGPESVPLKTVPVSTQSLNRPLMPALSNTEVSSHEESLV